MLFQLFCFTALRGRSPVKKNIRKVTPSLTQKSNSVSPVKKNNKVSKEITSSGEIPKLFKTEPSTDLMDLLQDINETSKVEELPQTSRLSMFYRTFKIHKFKMQEAIS